MPYCPKCSLAYEEGDKFCQECGANLPEVKPLIPAKKKAPSVSSSQDKTSTNGFFSFRYMISNTLIKIFYILGMAAITIYGIREIVRDSSYESFENVGYALGIIIFGNLIWRLICEGLILLFNMHDILASIERKLGEK